MVFTKNIFRQSLKLGTGLDIKEYIFEKKVFKKFVSSLHFGSSWENKFCLSTGCFLISCYYIQALKLSSFLMTLFWNSTCGLLNASKIKFAYYTECIYIMHKRMNTEHE